MSKRRARPDGTIEYTEETARTVFERSLLSFLTGSGRVVLYVLGTFVILAVILAGLWLTSE